MKLEASKRLVAAPEPTLPKFLGGLEIKGEYTKNEDKRDGGFWISATYKGTLNIGFEEFGEFQRKVKKQFPKAEKFLIAQRKGVFLVEFFTKE